MINFWLTSGIDLTIATASKMSNEVEEGSLVGSLPDASKKSGLSENEIKSLNEAVNSIKCLRVETPREPECQFNDLFTAVVVTKWSNFYMIIILKLANHWIMLNEDTTEKS